MASDESAIHAYEIVLADLRARREQIDHAISAIEALIGAAAVFPGAGGLSATASVTSPTPTPEVVRPGMFLGNTIADAGRKVLEINKRTMKTREILDSILLGGIHMTSAQPINVVQTILGRQKDIVKVARGEWGLTAWYPSSGRFKKAKRQGDSTEEGDESDRDDDDSSSSESSLAIEQTPAFKVVS
jgi:hypothetical protein